MSADRTVLIAITCPLTDDLRSELDELGVKLMERSDPLLLKLLIRHLRAALVDASGYIPPAEIEQRPVRHALPRQERRQRKSGTT